jgi:hypothetical protein
MTDRHVDDAIDQTVREMMDADPPPGLRARVLSRLDRSAAAPWTWPRLVTVSSAAAVVVLGFLLVRAPKPTPPPDMAPPVSSVTAPARPPEVAPVPTDRAPQTTGAAPLPIIRSRPAQPGAVAAARSDYKTDNVVPIAALEDIAPLSLAPLRSPSITPDGIVIEPIKAITELNVEPLWDGRR